MGVSYHRRQHRNGLGIVDRARPADAYTPEARTYVDPTAPDARTITIYKLQPEFGTLAIAIITNVDVLESDYDGVQFDVQKRMSNRWQMLAGLSLQKHKGFDHSGTFTNPDGTRDFNNPNYLINRDDGSVFTDLPWTFTLSGSYHAAVVGHHDLGQVHRPRRRPAGPRRTCSRSPTRPTSQPSETIRVAPARRRTAPRRSTSSSTCASPSGSRSASPTSSATIDLFNLLNANHVLLPERRTIGTHLGTSQRAS